MPKVAIITPATGRKELRQCLESVAKQTFTNLEHVVVVDGATRERDVMNLISEGKVQPTVMVLPSATGLHQFGGHRIYGAMPFITNAEWICYLDEDNWIDHDHISSLVGLVESYRLQWAYSLRKIRSWSGSFICNDDCNSLGWWPAFDGAYNHVDTNCYFMRMDVAVKVSPIWHRRSVDPDVETADRTLCMTLLREYPYAFTTGKYTSNYRIGSRISEARCKAFYTLGNTVMETFYKKFPWAETDLRGRLVRHPCLGWKVRSTDPKLCSLYHRVDADVSPAKSDILPVYEHWRENPAWK